jgi:hypothetical protein
MRFADAAADRLNRVPVAAVLAGLVVLQLVSLAALASSGDWSASAGDALVGGALVAAELLMIYAVGRVLAGPVFALAAALVWIVAPLVLLRYWVIGGSPATDWGPIYHEQFLPSAFGFEKPSAVLAGALLLASAWLALARLARATIAAAGAGAAAAAAAFAHPRVWPALAAPVLAPAVARRPRATLACAATALAGLGLLALLRDVPGIHPGWHTIGHSLDQFREYSWSRRLLEYLPLAGLIGLARRSPAACALFGWLLVTVIVFPLGRMLDLLPLLSTLVPGLPAYAFLTASIVFLVPHRRTRAAGERGGRPRLAHEAPE